MPSTRIVEVAERAPIWRSARETVVEKGACA
jgi:hypothetical protein